MKDLKHAAVLVELLQVVVVVVVVCVCGGGHDFQFGRMPVGVVVRGRGLNLAPPPLQGGNWGWSAPQAKFWLLKVNLSSIPL